MRALRCNAQSRRLSDSVAHQQQSIGCERFLNFRRFRDPLPHELTTSLHPAPGESDSNHFACLRKKEAAIVPGGGGRLAGTPVGCGFRGLGQFQQINHNRHQPCGETLTQRLNAEIDFDVPGRQPDQPVRRYRRGGQIGRGPASFRGSDY